MSVIVRRILRINYDVAIVIRRTRIIAPNVCVGDLMIRIVRAGRQVCVIPEDFTNLENPGRCASVSFFLAKAGLVLPGESCSPCQPLLAKQHRKRSSHNLPITTTRALKQSQFAARRIPRWRDSPEKLCAIVRNTLGECIDATEHQQANHESPKDSS